MLLNFSNIVSDMRRFFRKRFNAKIQEHHCDIPGGGTHDIFGRGCATIKSLYRPFLEFLTKKLDAFRNFCA